MKFFQSLAIYLILKIPLFGNKFLQLVFFHLVHIFNYPVDAFLHPSSL